MDSPLTPAPYHDPGKRPHPGSARSHAGDPAFLTIASTGPRTGGLLGLQVGDVDLERSKLFIRLRIRKRQVSSPNPGKPRTVDVPRPSNSVLRDASHVASRMPRSAGRVADPGRNGGLLP